MRLYRELAAWWPLLGDPADYAEEAGVYGDLLAAACDAPIESLLELGCGGGNSASHMKRRFRRLLLTDVSPEMLAVSRALNPECEHRLGDMRTLRLGRTFDVVFVHDAVCYMTTESDLRSAMETAWLHCRPGGAVLFAPDYGPAAPCSSRRIVDYAFLLRDRDGSVRAVQDRHGEGLFARDCWLDLLTGVGFEARGVPLVLSDVEPGRHEMFVARRPR